MKIFFFSSNSSPQLSNLPNRVFKNALQRNDVTNVKKWIFFNINLNSRIKVDENTTAYPLAIAIMTKSVDMVKVLLNAGADINVGGPFNHEVQQCL